MFDLNITDRILLGLILSAGSNPCELSCMALGHNFYYNFGHVLDGTPCSDEGGVMCVSGRCLVSYRLLISAWGSQPVCDVF